MPKRIKAVPNKAKARWVCSPKSNPNTAVAANVVALVTGTASEIGVWLSMAKKVAEAERFTKKGIVYCQIERSLSQLLTEVTSLWRAALGCAWAEEDLRAWSHRRAPRRIRALVAPQTRPTAIIFSMSPTIGFEELKIRSLSVSLVSSLYLTWMTVMNRRKKKVKKRRRRNGVVLFVFPDCSQVIAEC